jgi:hypothetical protein
MEWEYPERTRPAHISSGSLTFVKAAKLAIGKITNSPIGR